MATAFEPIAAEAFLPEEFARFDDPQTALPALAKSSAAMATIAEAVKQIPTRHQLVNGDARAMELPTASVHLVLTSPPYWTLKRYEEVEGQLGHFADYEGFVAELDRVWQHCFNALVPGGRLICVVGDVCLSRKKNAGRHMVVPLHASIQEHCRRNAGPTRR
jgi:DNA modification methylase